MKRVRAEGTEYFYIDSLRDAIAAQATLGLFRIDEFMQSRLDLAKAFRLVAVRHPFKKEEYVPYFLFWTRPVDLAELDRRVGEETYTDDDFSASLKTVHQETFCANCKSRWHTLVAPTGDPYMGSPGLMQRKLASARALLCPECHGSLRQMVVKIFEKVK